ncbi:MAG TPA: MFS transporter [Ktedonobacteraceae bacterium]|jgi:fucose permease
MKTSSIRYARLSIGLSFYSFALVGLNSGTNGVILRSLSTYYHVGDAVVGTLFFASALSYALSSFFCGPLAERLGLRWLLALGTALFLLGTLGYILEVPFILLLAFRLGIGLGTGIIETGFNIFISTLPRSTSLLNYLHAFFGVGTVFGPLLATGILALLWGWNMVYVALALLNLLQLGGIVLLLGVPAREKSPSQERLPTERNAFREALALPLVWLTSLFLLVYTGVEICASSWGYTYLVDNRALSALAAGWMISGFGIGLTLGRFLIQPLAERKGVGVAPLMYMLIGGAILSLLVTWLMPSGFLAGLSFSLLGLSLAPIYPLTVALIPKLVPERLVPSAIGILVSVSISGLSVLPWLAGVLAQIQGIWTLIPYLLVLVLILLAFWIYLARPVSISEAAQKQQVATQTVDS